MDSYQTLNDNANNEDRRSNDGDNSPNQHPLRLTNQKIRKSEPVDIEEQIIRKRGRRQWIKMTPRTPTRKRRALSRDPSESPFSKCLNGLMSPIPACKQSSNSSNLPPFIASTKVQKRFYYSPNPPYYLRSLDTTKCSARNLKNDNSQISLNDSGIGMSPNTSDDLERTISSTLNNSTSQCAESSSSTLDTQISSTRLNNSNTTRRINRVRRRFRF